jgi:hypothetical protein
MISVYCNNIKNTQIYFVDKMKSLYLLQEVVSGVTVGLLSFKQNKYRDISDYFVFHHPGLYTPERAKMGRHN